MVTIVSALYFAMAGILALLTLWQLIRSDSVLRTVSLALVSIPLILRALMIK